VETRIADVYCSRRPLFSHVARILAATPSTRPMGGHPPLAQATSPQQNGSASESASIPDVTATSARPITLTYYETPPWAGGSGKEAKRTSGRRTRFPLPSTGGAPCRRRDRHRSQRCRRRRKPPANERPMIDLRPTVVVCSKGSDTPTREAGPNREAGCRSQKCPRRTGLPETPTGSPASPIERPWRNWIAHRTSETSRAHRHRRVKSRLTLVYSGFLAPHTPSPKPYLALEMGACGYRDTRG